MMTRSMTRIAELEARIAELEKENKMMKEKYNDLWDYGRDDYCEVNIVNMLLEEGNKKRVMEVWSDVYEFHRNGLIDDEDEDDKDEDSDEEGCLNCYYICRYCFAFGTEDPDCTRCGRKRCVLLYQEQNASMAIQAAKDLLAIQAANEVDLIGHRLAKAKSKNDDEDDDE